MKLPIPWPKWLQRQPLAQNKSRMRHSLHSKKTDKQRQIEKKNIKDGRVGLRVTELEKTKLRIDTLVRNHHGYYQNESFNNTYWESTFSLKIRIPCQNFEKFIACLETGHGEFLYKQVDARDVTDQFIDLETRLENKRNYLTRYKELLRKANTVNEILEIEEKNTRFGRRN